MSFTVTTKYLDFSVLVIRFESLHSFKFLLDLVKRDFYLNIKTNLIEKNKKKFGQ